MISVVAPISVATESAWRNSMALNEKNLYDAFASGNYQKAQSYERTILKYDAIVGQYGGKPAARVLPLLLGGVDLGPPRSPLVAITNENLIALKAALSAAGFL